LQGTHKNQYSWIFSKQIDSWLFLATPFFFGLISLIGLFVVNDADSGSLPILLLAMVWLILAFDTGHIFTTVFRAGVFPGAPRPPLGSHFLVPSLLLIANLTVCRFFGFRIFLFLFAQLNIFHFIRQQYGFMAIYRRNDRLQNAWTRRLDALVVHCSTIVPLFFLYQNKNVGWWGPETVYHPPVIPEFNSLVISAMVTLALLYLIKEIYFSVKSGQVNWPKNLVVLSTALVWSEGAYIANKGLLSLAMIGVTGTHVFQYTGLIWFYGRKSIADGARPPPRLAWLTPLFSIGGIALYIGIIVFIGWFYPLQKPPMAASNSYWKAISLWKAVFVAIYFAPTQWHFIMDGFIWRGRFNDAGLKHRLDPHLGPENRLTSTKSA
jgi:hypothetical protein